MIGSTWLELVSQSVSQAADNSRCPAPVITKKVSRHDSCEGSHSAVIYDRLGTLLQVVCVRGQYYAPELCVGVRKGLASNSSRDREVRFRMQMLGEMFHGAGNR